MLPVRERVLVAGPSVNLRANASAVAAFNFAPRVLEATGWAGCAAVFWGCCWLVSAETTLGDGCLSLSMLAGTLGVGCTFDLIACTLEVGR